MAQSSVRAPPRKVLRESEINLTNSSRVIPTFVPKNLCNNVYAYFIGINTCYTWTCHLSSPCYMTGMHLTRCLSLDCSSASFILGSSFTRSRLRNAWTTYSASWRVMQLWTIGSQLMKPTNKIQRNSLIILTAPWMMRSPP